MSCWYAPEVTTPNLESAEAAVETLRAELGMIDAALDAIDRKAALIPVVVGAIAGIFIAPDSTFTGGQTFFLVAALVSGVGATIAALRVMWARDLNVGPNAQATAGGVHLPPEYFNRAVASSFAMSVDALSELAKWKAKLLNIAMWFAAATILLLALARLAGGISVPDDQGTQQQPTQAPATAPASPATSGGGDTPASQPAQADIPVNFGQQIASKGGLPADLEIRIDKIEKRG